MSTHAQNTAAIEAMAEAQRCEQEKIAICDHMQRDQLPAIKQAIEDLVSALLGAPAEIMTPPNPGKRISRKDIMEAAND